MRKIAPLFAAMSLVALAACSSDSKKPDENANIVPKNYETEILLTLTGQLIDPTNIRDAGITEPALREAGREQRYTVCVRYNPRDAARRYEGVKEVIAYFYGGELNQLIAADKGQCAGAAYKPWTELEKYCMAKKCV